MKQGNKNLDRVIELGKIQESLQILLKVIANKTKNHELGQIEDYISQIDDAIKTVFYDSGSDIEQKIKVHNNNNIVNDFEVGEPGSMFSTKPLVIKSNSASMEKLSGINEPRVEVKVLRLIQWINATKRQLKRNIDGNFNLKNEFNKTEIFSFMKKFKRSDINDFVMCYANGGDVSKYRNKDILQAFNEVLNTTDRKGNKINKDWCISMIATKNTHNTILSLKDKLIDELLRHHVKQNNLDEQVSFYRKEDKSAISSTSDKKVFDTIIGAKVENFSEPFEFHLSGDVLNEIEKILKVNIPEQDSKDAQENHILKTGIQVDLKNNKLYGELQKYLKEKVKNKRGEDIDAR